MLKIKIDGKEFKKENIKNVRHLLKEFFILQNACLVRRGEKFLAIDEELKEGDEVEIITVGWEIK